MSHQYDGHNHQQAEQVAALRGGIAPGKRTLTQSLPPRSDSLRDQQRVVASMDDGIDDDFYDERAVVVAAPSELLLDSRQLRRARRVNRRVIERVGAPPNLLSSADVSSDAFALDVAEKQQAAGIAVDGIAGPQTVAAVAERMSSERSSRAPKPSGATTRPTLDFDDGVETAFYDERATVDADDRPATAFADDPFGMHLIGQR